MPNLIEAAKLQIDEMIKAAYGKARDEGLLPSGGEAVQGTVDIPRDPSHGDYASAFAMAAARALKMPPRKIAEQVVPALDMAGSYFTGADVAGAGFINFKLSEKWYRDVLVAVESAGKDYGRSNIGAGKKVMVEFVSANPTGLMTIGNARGGVLGDTTAAVLDRAGYDVWREFYVNDAGNQVELFAKSMEVRYLQLIQGEDAVKFPEDGYHGEDIKELAKTFYEVHGDKYLEVPEERRRADMKRFGLERNIAKMQSDLARYGIAYDCWFRESTLHETGYVDETIEMLRGGGYTYEKDGALWLDLTAMGAEKDEVLRRGNGYYTYFAVDLAYHRDKFVRRGFDKVIDVLGADHHGHAIRFQAALPAIGVEKDKLEFLIMQLVRLVRDGETVKVSKRTGMAITLADLLDEIPRDAARFFFSSKPDTHLEFDMDLAVRQDSENPIYYIQYAHARICSLMETLRESGERLLGAEEIDMARLDGAYEKNLIKHIARLPEEIHCAARDYDPSRINKYAQELAAAFHGFYNNCRMKGETSAVAGARLCLSGAARRVIACTLDILGVCAPERM